MDDEMMRIAVGAAIATLCMPLLLACASDPDVATPPVRPTETTSRTPSTTLTAPSAAPTSAEPTSATLTPHTAPPLSRPRLPLVAQQHSVAGARSFVRFYFAVTNYTFASRSGAMMRQYSTRACRSCREMAATMDKLRRNGGEVHGGKTRVLSISRVPVRTLDNPLLHTTLLGEGGTWRQSKSAPLRVLKRFHWRMDVELVWSLSHWMVAGFWDPSSTPAD